MFLKVATLQAACWALASCLLFCSVTDAYAQSPVPKLSRSSATGTGGKSPASSGRYYIDFRAARIGTYGHSYVAYGRLSPSGEPVDAHYADLHPMGNYLIMALGHVLPVPANTQWDPDVLALPIASSYFRSLNAAQYASLQAALQRARQNKEPYWNAITNNCNHFVAELAQAIGLRVPTDLLVSYAFVPALRRLNESSDSLRVSHKRDPELRDTRAPSPPPKS